MMLVLKSNNKTQTLQILHWAKNFVNVVEQESKAFCETILVMLVQAMPFGGGSDRSYLIVTVN